MPSDDTTTTTTLQTDLRRLGLNYTADQLNDLIALATRKRWSHTVLLEHIVAAELEEKQRRSVESRLKRARLGRFKPLADWDWDWPSALDRPALERVLTLDFLGRSENLILVGAHGLGKTMLAKNIAHQAVLAGHTALFTTAADLLLDLNGQETARALERRLRHYTRPTLLVVDELGYLSYDARAADLIFQLVSRRYEHRSMLITTNLPFKRWDTVFPNASCAVALIDRLTHHAEVLPIEGRSYRRREAELNQQERNRKRPNETTQPNDRARPHVVKSTGQCLSRKRGFTRPTTVWCTRSGPTDIAQLAVDFIENDLDNVERQQMTANPAVHDPRRRRRPVHAAVRVLLAGQPHRRPPRPRQPHAPRRPADRRRPVLAVQQDSQRLRQVPHRHRRTLRPAAPDRVHGSEHPHPRGARALRRRRPAAQRRARGLRRRLPLRPPHQAQRASSTSCSTAAATPTRARRTYSRPS